jgi:hypothetical protein
MKRHYLRVSGNTQGQEANMERQRTDWGAVMKNFLENFSLLWDFCFLSVGLLQKIF